MSTTVQPVSGTSTAAHVAGARAAITRAGIVIARAVTITALVANAAIHLYLTPAHLAEAPYLGAGFLALSVATIMLAAGLVVADSWPLWAGVAAVNAAGFGAFIASRVIGLPRIAEEVGQWADPLGIATMVVELLAFVVAARVLAAGGRR